MTITADADQATLDLAVADLQAHSSSWVNLSLQGKLDLLQRLKPRVMAEAPTMVALSQQAKGLHPDGEWGAEDWMTGPWALLQGITSLETCLRRVERGQSPLESKAVRTRPDGQVVVDVFPATRTDALLLNGYRANVWMQPGLTPAQVLADAARMYRGAGYADPGVTLVLGAGNVGSITTLDVLHVLYAEGSVAIVKMNPVNDYLAPVFERIFADFVERGWLRFVRGGASVGGYLAHHQGIDAVHMTGSAATHDAIVWGTGPEAESRRRGGTPLLDKPITSELGGVSPMIVAPGRWSDADLDFQAAHIVTSKLNNAGHNCIATQVIVLPQAWPQADDLLDRVRSLISRLPSRPAYYPRASERIEAAASAHGDAEVLGDEGLCVMVPQLPIDAAASLLTDEVFAGAMGVVRLPGDDVDAYLRQAVRFANEELPGTLGASMLVDPATERTWSQSVDRAIADLRYGCVGVNAWSALGFLLGYSPWGAFPGHTLQDIGSGQGFVHNAFLLHGVQKAVVRMPFRPMHRSFLSGQPHMSPTPPFFVTNRTAQTTVQRLCSFLADGRPADLAGIFASALRG